MDRNDQENKENRNDKGWHLSDTKLQIGRVWLQKIKEQIEKRRDD